MSGYKTILMATDFSKSSGKAAEHARILAGLCQGRLHLLHVITELTDKRRRRLPAELVKAFVKEVESQALEDMNDFVERYFADAAQAGYQVTTEVVLGSGYEDILAQAKTVGAELIVLGTHGKTGLEKVLVGSTAERVLAHSSTPVLIVKE